MKTKVKYLFSIALAALTAASCSDTWDEHYGTADSTGTASETIWDLIKNDSRLSNFAELAENAVYYREETKPQKNYTFKDLLDGDQIVTAFIPANDAYTPEQWDSLKLVQKEYPYTLYQQLMANTISLWRQTTIGSTAKDTVTMINGKKLVFDKGALTIGGSEIEQNDMAAKNGVLHIVKKTVPFHYNLYEYLKDAANAEENHITMFHDFLVKNDTTMFDENNSIEGNPDNNGNPTYVDSVEYVMNYLTIYRKRFPNNINTDQYLTYDESFGAPITSEDSTFVMIIPTDNAYQQAFDKLSRYYKYADSYLDSEKANQNNSGITRDVSNPDSLMKKSLHMDIFSPIVYNVNLQPNAYGRICSWTISDFLQNSGQATYFLNTYGDTLRSDDTWQKETLFQGTPIQMSNGCGIVADTWNLPAKLYKPDVNVEANLYSMFNLQKFNERNRVETIGFSNNAASDWVDATGRVSHDNFISLRPNSTNDPMSVEFRLVGNDQELSEAEVMSGKYDIYVVCVPEFYVDYANGVEDINMESDFKKTKLAATVKYNDGNIKTTKKDAESELSDIVIYEGQKVDTLLLIKDFEFPYSYKNMIHCYPTLTISTQRATMDEQAEGFTHSINIDRIILKSKD